jgi:phosphatidylserine synthase
MEKGPPGADNERPQPALRIYFLPNLMTAGNLFCGFVALTKIVEAKIGADGLDYAPSWKSNWRWLFHPAGVHF